MLQRGRGQEGGHFYHVEALVSAVWGEVVRWRKPAASESEVRGDGGEWNLAAYCAQGVRWEMRG